MKPFVLSLALLAPTACDRPAAPSPAPPPKIETVSDIPTPINVGPPVQAKSYDDGYKAGDLAGEAAVKNERIRAPKQRLALPPASELDVLALDAAGYDTTRGLKWQRGFVAGFKDGFLRAAEGKR